MRGRHMQMENSMEDNRLFGGHRNPERRSRLRMPLSQVKEGFPVRIGSARCSGGQRRDICAQTLVWEGWEWCLVEFALGELEGRGRECVNCWRSTRLEAKIETKGMK